MSHYIPDAVDPRAQPSLTAATLKVLLWLAGDEIQPENYQSFQRYYDSTWYHAMRTGAALLDPLDHQDIQAIVESMSVGLLGGSNGLRPSLRRELSKNPRFAHRAEESLDGIIALALRLWLTLDIRHDASSRPTKSIEWDDKTPLRKFIESQFPPARLLRDATDRVFDHVLPEDLTVVNLLRYSGIKIDWMMNLSEHLDWDRENRILKVFPLKSYLQGLRSSDVESIPNAIIDEYMQTMNFLFPTWDSKTQEYLRRQQEAFRLEGPVAYPGIMYLSDFYFFRDRLSVLYTEFCSPPPSMKQLFYDRRNVLQWYTFWFAVFIVALTIVFGVISTVTACLQTKYSHQALLLAIEAADAASTCSLVCNNARR